MLYNKAFLKPIFAIFKKSVTKKNVTKCYKFWYNFKKNQGFR